MNRINNENYNNKYSSFEFKKCKICQCRDFDTNNYRTSKKYLVNGEFHCLTCLEKEKLLYCRWCHGNINPVHAHTRGKALFVHGGDGWNNEIDVATVCCIQCLDRITKKRGISNNGGWKKCETANCRFTLSPNEEACGNEKCYHCWKKEYDKIQAERNKAGEEYGKKYRQAHEKAQNWWNILSSSERERECERLVENMKLGKYWANNVREGEASGSAHEDFYMWQIKNGKFVSDTPHKVPIQIAEEFVKKEFGETGALVLRDYTVIKNNPDKSGNSSRPNPADPQLITNSGGKSDNSVSPTNSPQPNLGPDIRSDNKISIKPEDRNKNTTSGPDSANTQNKNDNKTLIINLKEVKKITLWNDGRLEIEFNNPESENYSLSQVISSEQINNNQELRKVKDYCQQNNRTSLGQQELNNLLQNTENNSSLSHAKPQNYQTLWISLGIGGTLIVGVIAGLLLAKKKKNSKIAL